MEEFIWSFGAFSSQFAIEIVSYARIISANMYIWDPYGQNLGIYRIRVLHGPHIGFFAHVRLIEVPYWYNSANKHVYMGTI